MSQSKSMVKMSLQQKSLVLLNGLMLRAAMDLFIGRILMKTSSFIKQLLLRTIHESTYVVLVMTKKSNLILYKVKKVMKPQM